MKYGRIGPGLHRDSRGLFRAPLTEARVVSTPLETLHSRRALERRPARAPVCLPFGAWVKSNPCAACMTQG